MKWKHGCQKCLDWHQILLHNSDMNYKAPLIKSLGEAGFAAESVYGGSRMTFTQLRKNGTRRVKLWFGNDVWEAKRSKQELLEARLKINYGEAYLGGYFIRGARGGLSGERSFCVILDQSKLAS